MTERPVIAARFTLADGTVLARDWYMADLADVRGGTPELFRGTPPDWLFDRARAWDNPQDPITFTGTVKTGCEADAREALGL